MVARIVLIGFVVFVLAAAEDRWTGGSNAPKSQAFVVSIRYGGVHRCSGFSMTTRHVITTARCVKGMIPGLIEVYANKVTSNDLIRFAVIGSSIHDSYAPSTLDYDIAVLTAVAPTGEVLENAVGTIQAAIKPNGLLTVIGWAKDGLNMILKKFNVNYILPELCKKFYVITSTMVCTTAQSLGDTCPGDEGSVLIQGGAVVGIVSRTVGCQDLKPTMYTYLAQAEICSFLDTATQGLTNCTAFARP